MAGCCCRLLEDSGGSASKTPCRGFEYRHGDEALWSKVGVLYIYVGMNDSKKVAIRGLKVVEVAVRLIWRQSSPLDLLIYRAVSTMVAIPWQLFKGTWAVLTPPARTIRYHGGY
jgi:hypothetical protein